jgi:uncharacterized membrane protein YbjE (DUF340 family)
MIKYIFTALGIGVISGYLNHMYGSAIINGAISDYLFNGLLIALLFVMGIAFGSDKESLDKLKKASLKVLIIPFSVALGSILGGLIGGVILGIEVVSSMAICAGYGWYSLTGPLISQIFGPELGTLGFTVNFLRELLTITAISLVVKLDKYAPIASGGATTMDTTLPIIVRHCGSDVLVTAFSSGFILTLTAPFTILAIASLR